MAILWATRIWERSGSLWNVPEETGEPLKTVCVLMAYLGKPASSDQFGNFVGDKDMGDPGNLMECSGRMYIFCWFPYNVIIMVCCIGLWTPYGCPVDAL
jgi:hypothetical protein